MDRNGSPFSLKGRSLTFWMFEWISRKLLSRMSQTCQWEKGLGIWLANWWSVCCYLAAYSGSGEVTCVRTNIDLLKEVSWACPKERQNHWRYHLAAKTLSIKGVVQHNNVCFANPMCPSSNHLTTAAIINCHGPWCYWTENIHHDFVAHGFCHLQNKGRRVFVQKQNLMPSLLCMTLRRRLSHHPATRRQFPTRRRPTCTSVSGGSTNILRKFRCKSIASWWRHGVAILTSCRFTRSVTARSLLDGSSSSHECFETWYGAVLDAKLSPNM